MDQHEAPAAPVAAPAAPRATRQYPAYLLLLANAGVILGFWAWNHVHSPMGNMLTLDRTTMTLAAGRLAGLLAVYAILLQFILAGRVRWVERVFGLDRLFRVHHAVGISLVFLILAHPLLVGLSASWTAGVSLWAQTLDFLQNWEDVAAATVGLCVFLAVVALSVALVRRRLKYEWWYVTHLAVYAAILLAFGHQLEVGGDFTGNRWFAAYWYALYAAVGLTFVWFRAARPLRNLWRHRFTVVRLVPETDDVTSVYITGRAFERWPVQAGQFVIVRFLVKGFRWQAHPFSISAVPDGREIRLTIKAIGDYTRRISELQPGTRVLIDGPHGLFTAQRSVRPKVLAIAGGIGITPIRSVTEELLQAGHEVVLLYANRQQRGIALGKELADLAARYPGLRLVHVLNADPGWGGEEGYIDRERIARLVPDAAERDVYLCGPPPMMRLLVKDLRSLGVPRQRLYYERFAL